MVKSKSEQYLEKRSIAPEVSNNMYRSVSQYRRATLEEDVSAGKFREPGAGSSIYASMGGTELGTVIGGGRLKKMANEVGVESTRSAAGKSFRGAGDTIRQSPEIYSPLWLTSNLNLPRDRATINAWCRAFFALNPIVQNAITLHSTYPISKLNITCKNKKVERFFNEMIEETDLLNTCVQLAQEYWMIGEAVIYGDLDERKGSWGRFLIQNPDYIIIQHSVVGGDPLISLRPDENLKRVITSNRPSDIQQRQKLTDNIIQHVRKGENIPLSNFYASHFARKLNPYELRGTGLPVSCFRQLMLFDMLRECKFVQASSLVNPLTLVKIGSQDFKPAPADLEAYREIFEAAESDKNFKIFTHQDVTVERVGASGAIVDISGDVTQLIKEIYSGLMVPSAVMDGGADTSYANASVALDVLRQRYMEFRNKMSTWLRRKVFAPISKIQEFYEYKDGQKVLIVPEVEWNHMNLFDSGDYISAISQLASGEAKSVSKQSLYRSLGLDYENERRKLREESIHEILANKEKEAMSLMNLNELRALGPDDLINESPEAPLPGETKLPGEEGSDLGGGLDMPAMPEGLPPISAPPAPMPPAAP